MLLMEVAPVPDGMVMKSRVAQLSHSAHASRCFRARSYGAWHVWENAADDLVPHPVIPDVQQACPKSKTQLRDQERLGDWFRGFRQASLRFCDSLLLRVGKKPDLVPQSFRAGWCGGDFGMNNVPKTDLQNLKHRIQGFTQRGIPEVSAERPLIFAPGSPVSVQPGGRKCPLQVVKELIECRAGLVKLSAQSGG